MDPNRELKDKVDRSSRLMLLDMTLIMPGSLQDHKFKLMLQKIKCSFGKHVFVYDSLIACEPLYRKCACCYKTQEYIPYHGWLDFLE